MRVRSTDTLCRGECLFESFARSHLCTYLNEVQLSTFYRKASHILLNARYILEDLTSYDWQVQETAARASHRATLMTVVRIWGEAERAPYQWDKKAKRSPQGSKT